MESPGRRNPNGLKKELPRFFVNNFEKRCWQTCGRHDIIQFRALRTSAAPNRRRTSPKEHERSKRWTFKHRGVSQDIELGSNRAGRSFRKKSSSRQLGASRDVTARMHRAKEMKEKVLVREVFPDSSEAKSRRDVRTLKIKRYWKSEAQNCQ
jgi:hypothetical protein